MIEVLPDFVQDESKVSTLTYESWHSYSMDEKVSLLKQYINELQEIEKNLGKDKNRCHNDLIRRKQLKNNIKEITMFESLHYEKTFSSN